MYVFLFPVSVHVDGVNTIRLKKHHSYYHQVQGQIYMTNSQACDFMIWTPKDSVIIRVGKDQAWQENISKLTDFYFNKFVSYLKEL